MNDVSIENWEKKIRIRVIILVEKESRKWNFYLKTHQLVLSFRIFINLYVLYIIPEIKKIQKLK